jgi:hypothetical protein
MKSQSHLLLTRRHQRGLWLRPLSIAASGLLLALIFAALGVGPWYQLGAIGVFLVLGLGARVFSRRTLHDTARRLDERPGARNRLEAVAELGQRTDSLAAALRAEADGYFAQEPLPRSYAWPAAIAALAVLLIANVTGYRDRERSHEHPLYSPDGIAGGKDQSGCRHYGRPCHNVI